MGGEGVAWSGQAPFTEENHVFANMGDGTYFHSGYMAVRASVAAGVCCAAAAVGREIYNQANGGKFDLADIAWTLAGGAYPITFAFLIT